VIADPSGEASSANPWGSTRREEAELLLAAGVVIRGEVHTQALSPHHEGPESVEEFLNRDQPFFALTQADGGVLFVAKAQVAVVSCAFDGDAMDPARASVAKLLRLEVTLRDGTEIAGSTSVELPPMRARAIDFLNLPEPFFTLWDEVRTRHVNRAWIRTVRPLE
jgi:hypothetical protein